MNETREAIEQAIEYLNRRLEVERKYDVMSPKFYKALELGIKALKKQVPLSVISREYENGRFNYDCPVCKRKIISKIDGKWCGGSFQEYCDRCGQKLDWSNDNENTGGSIKWT